MSQMEEMQDMSQAQKKEDKSQDEIISEMRSCNALASMANSFNLSKEDRKKAYETIRAAVPVFRSAFKALRAAFPNIDDDAAERLAAAYRKWLQRLRDQENADDISTPQNDRNGHETEDKCQISLERILEAISIMDLAQLQILADHLGRRILVLKGGNK